MIRIERPDPDVVTITFDRQRARNALTFAMWDQLPALVAELNADEALRAVVMTGAGAAAFVSGTDIGEFAAVKTGADGVAYEARIERAIAALMALHVPAIAAVRGACTGGGVSIAAACDLRIGGPSTRVGIPIARTLGNAVSTRNIARLAALIGLDAARALVLTGRLLDAPAALGAGFFTELVGSDDDIVPRALDCARELAALAPVTLRTTKAMVRRLLDAQPIPDDADLLQDAYGSDDFRTGVSGFIARERRRWRGR